MPEREFVNSIIEVATKLKGSQITAEEKDLIIKSFNSKSGTPYEKAKAAIEEVVGQKFPETTFLLEKSASLNNLQNLLAQMGSAADKWQKSKGK